MACPRAYDSLEVSQVRYYFPYESDGFRYILDDIGAHKVDNIVDEALVQLLDRVTSLVGRIWQFAKPVLCNDAPEGFVPDELDDDSALTTKDISSYAWRSVKEAR